MFLFVFFFKQKTAYEMRISDWSSDVCSSDLPEAVKEERYQRIMEKTAAISAAKLAAKVGRTLPVIIDEVGEADDEGSIGATGRSQADAPEIDGHVYLRDVAATLTAGAIVDVLVEDADEHDLFGVVAG